MPPESDFKLEPVYVIARELPDPVKVIESGPATVVLFSDGTKSVVKLAIGDWNDPEKAVMAAMLKRYKRGWQDAVRKCGVVGL